MVSQIQQILLPSATEGVNPFLRNCSFSFVFHGKIDVRESERNRPESTRLRLAAKIVPTRSI
jgi:hypothetical protein